ncbi:cornichon protein-domain-containing protein [Blastocladiella britannica]|nr:cornichon protein-domain-containing protein [Blastocladiella britannica]
MISDAVLFLFAVVMSALLLFAMVFFIIMFSDLECDYINPIDLCNKLNQACTTKSFDKLRVYSIDPICIQFVMPEFAAHWFLTACFALTGSWMALVINLPLAGYHVKK